MIFKLQLVLIPFQVTVVIPLLHHRTVIRLLRQPRMEAIRQSHRLRTEVTPPHLTRCRHTHRLIPTLSWLTDLNPRTEVTLLHQHTPLHRTTLTHNRTVATLQPQSIRAIALPRIRRRPMIRTAAFLRMVSHHMDTAINRSWAV